MIQVENIEKSFGSLQVLRGISLNINKGEVVSIVGPSGAGKTTLLQIMGTLDTPNAGKVIINGMNVLHFKEKELSAFRNQHIGFVFQFHQQGRMDRTLRNIDQIRVAAARIDFGEQRVVVLRLVEGQLDGVAEGGF